MEKNNLKFSAELIFGMQRLEKIPCEIFFPKTQNEKLILKAELNTKNFSLLEIPFIFSLNSTTYDDFGNLLTSISADKVYNLGIKTSFYSLNQVTEILTAEPVNLKIQNFISQKYNKRKEKSFYFWLSQSIQLAPVFASELHYNGNVCVKNIHQKEFEIIEGLNFNFINYYSHYSEPEKNNTRISKPVLAAEFSGISEYELGESALSEIDLFLKLVSFSERREIVCYGYKGYLCREIIDFYRGDIFIPEEDFGYSHNETLIDIQDFDEFILQAFLFIKTCIFKDHLSDAVSKASYRKYDTLEGEYLSYYSALENLVNGYCDISNIQYILEDNSWKNFTKDLQSFIKNHKLFKDKKDKRKLIYEKIKKLNRASFITTFKEFCGFYQVALEDLWPLGGGGGSASLTEIRNRLIHGGRFEREEYNAIICAKSHLKWTLERCILRVLNWDVERSKVRPTFLEHYNDYIEWNQKADLLKNN